MKLTRESIDSYIQAWYEDVEERYRREVYKLRKHQDYTEEVRCGRRSWRSPPVGAGDTGGVLSHELIPNQPVGVPCLAAGAWSMGIVR